MDWQVIWSDAAITDLKPICDYIAARDVAAVQKVGQGILDHIRLPESFPFIGPCYPKSQAVRFGR